MHVTPLAEQHVAAYRELMLEAYERATDAFTTTVEERRAEPLSWWARRVGSAGGLTQALGAWQGDELVGSVALEFSPKPKTCHSALVLGMYVRPRYRGQGVGRLLMQGAVELASARPKVSVMTLTLTESNEPAQRLYESTGFVVWGTEPMAIRVPDGFKGRVYMSKLLPQASTAALHLPKSQS
jgi:ribosomal protein S18 acetylase RimI-like enzyme